LIHNTTYPLIKTSSQFPTEKKFYAFLSSPQKAMKKRTNIFKHHLILFN